MLKSSKLLWNLHKNTLIIFFHHSGRPWLGKYLPKHCFLNSGLTKSFTVCNFRNKIAMRIIFFFKMFKMWCRFQKWTKKSEKTVRFKDNCIWMGDDIFTQSWTGYLSLAVNVLRNTPKNLDITKGDIFKMRVSHGDEKIWSKCSDADFTRVWDPLTY